MISTLVRGGHGTFPARLSASLEALAISVRRSADTAEPSDPWLVLPTVRPDAPLTPVLDALDGVTDELARSNPSRVVLLSSPAIYEASAQHPGMVDESGWRHESARAGIARLWGDWEFRITSACRSREIPLAILRHATVPLEGAAGLHSWDNERAWARAHFGRNPVVQFLDVDDLARAVERVLTRPATGVYNVAPISPVRLRDVLRLWGRGLKPRDSAALRPYVDHVWTIDDRKLRVELGVQSLYSSGEALHRAGHVRPSTKPLAAVDAFGMNPTKLDRGGRRLFSFLTRWLFRVEFEGLEHLPTSGPVVLVGSHRGFVPLDAMLILNALRSRLGRTPRFLVHPALLRAPVISRIIGGLGGLVACHKNADWVLERGGVVGVFPEGVRGAFRPVRGAYRLGRFRNDFVDMAVTHGATVLPVVSVGTAEVFPIWRNLRWGWWQRRTGWPSLPLTHGLVLPLPLPTKWIIRFLPARRLPDVTPGVKVDPARARDIGGDLRAEMQDGLDALLRRRRGWFGALPG